MPISHYEIQDFVEALRDTDLSEYKTCGHFFLLSNKGLGAARICSRIDRCLVNSFWITKYPNLVVEYLNPGVSDHSPLILR